jgi:hypothetical protein
MENEDAPTEAEWNEFQKRLARLTLYGRLLVLQHLQRLQKAHRKHLRSQLKLIKGGMQ